jgi:sugar/nucleoside kinase (ribokinase family)
MKDSDNLEMLCIGHALVDIFAQTDDILLEKYGITASVQHIDYEKIIEILTNFPNYSAGSGGGAANVAKIAALLGIRAGFAGMVGEDKFGSVFEKSLSDAGAKLFLAKADEPTGACIFLQRPGEPNRVAAAPSVAYKLGPEHIAEDAVRQARAVVIDGYILNRAPLVDRILDLAGEYGTIVALDVGSVEMAEAHAADIARYCKDYPLILFMNLDEAETFYRALNHDSIDEEEGLTLLEKLIAHRNPLKQCIQTYLQKLTAGDLFPIIVVKLGAKGAMVFARGKALREDTLAIIPKNTVGAGDAFCAAFLGAWLRDKSFTECAGFGNRVAREVLDVNGTLVDKAKFTRLARILEEEWEA